MKRFALLMLSVFLLIQAPAWAEAGKIAVVDVSRAIKLSDGGKKASEVLMEKKMQGEQEARKQEEALKKLRDSLQEKLEFLTDEAKAEKELEFQKKLTDFQRFIKDTENEIGRLEEMHTKRLFERTEKVIKSLGDDGAYDVILAAGAVLYANDAIDLTDEVTKGLNALDKE